MAEVDTPSECRTCRKFTLHRRGTDGALHCLDCMNRPAQSGAVRVSLEREPRRTSWVTWLVAGLLVVGMVAAAAQTMGGREVAPSAAVAPTPAAERVPDPPAATKAGMRTPDGRRAGVAEINKRMVTDGNSLRWTTDGAQGSVLVVHGTSKCDAATLREMAATAPVDRLIELGAFTKYKCAEGGASIPLP